MGPSPKSRVNIIYPRLGSFVSTRKMKVYRTCRPRAIQPLGPSRTWVRLVRACNETEPAPDPAGTVVHDWLVCGEFMRWRATRFLTLELASDIVSASGSLATGSARLLQFLTIRNNWIESRSNTLPFDFGTTERHWAHRIGGFSTVHYSIYKYMLQSS